MEQGVIEVVATAPYTNRVLMYELDDRHPGGEAVLVSKARKPRAVFMTPRVVALLDAGTIEIAGDEDAPDADDPEADDPAKALAGRMDKDDLVRIAMDRGVGLSARDRKIVIAQKLIADGYVDAPEGSDDSDDDTDPGEGDDGADAG